METPPLERLPEYRAEFRHDQQWTIRLYPLDGVTWPLAKDYSGRQFQPTALHFHARSGGGYAGGQLTGLYLKQNGEVGKRRAHGGKLPEWARRMLVGERAARGLTDEFLREHGAIR